MQKASAREAHGTSMLIRAWRLEVHMPADLDHHLGESPGASDDGLRSKELASPESAQTTPGALEDGSNRSEAVTYSAEEAAEVLRRLETLGYV